MESVKGIQSRAVTPDPKVQEKAAEQRAQQSPPPAVQKANSDAVVVRFESKVRNEGDAQKLAESLRTRIKEGEEAQQPSADAERLIA